MEVIFQRSRYILDFSIRQIYSIFNYFNNCFFCLDDAKEFYEGGIIGFLKSGFMNIIPDKWVPKCERKPESYTISDKMMKIISKRKRERFEIHHLHSHLSDLPFPSPDDPYNVWESIGIVALGNEQYDDFRVFKQLGFGSYPPSLANISSEGKISTLVRFYHTDNKIEFLPIENEVKINVADAMFYRDW